MIRPVVAEKPYVPENGELACGLSRFIQPLNENVAGKYIPGFVLLRLVAPLAWKALNMLDVRTDMLTPAPKYECPYTNYSHLSVMPTAIISHDVEVYRTALKIMKLDHKFILNHDWHRKNQSDLSLVRSGIFDPNAVQRSQLGTGYTSDTLESDGHGIILPGKIDLDNGDWLFIHFWVWYNK